LKVKKLDFSAFWLSAVYRNTAQKKPDFIQQPSSAEVFLDWKIS